MVAAAAVRPIELDWNKIFELAWRSLVFLVAIAIIAIISTNWNRWEGAEGQQRTNDAYLESDLTPIVSKVAGYLRDLAIQDYQSTQGTGPLRSWTTTVSPIGSSRACDLRRQNRLPPRSNRRSWVGGRKMNGRGLLRGY